MIGLVGSRGFCQMQNHRFQVSTKEIGLPGSCVTKYQETLSSHFSRKNALRLSHEGQPRRDRCF